METWDPDPAYVANALASDPPRESDEWRHVARFVLVEPPEVAWDRLLLALEATVSDDAVAMLAVVAAEPLLQQHWAALMPLIEQHRDSALVKALLRGVILSGLPPDAEAFLEALAR